MTYGLEKEFFIKDAAGEYIMVPLSSKYCISYDDSGLLAEARGNPQNSIIDAVYSLKAAEDKLKRQAVIANVFLDDSPIAKLPKKLKIQAARQFAKGLISYQNIYGYDSHANSLAESTAGVHISFTNSKSYVNNNTTYYYNSMFDWLPIFKKLDKAFAQEIKEAKRRPGFYEIKNDGRIEYRSLPSNVDLDKVIDVLI